MFTHTSLHLRADDRIEFFVDLESGLRTIDIKPAVRDLDEHGDTTIVMHVPQNPEDAGLVLDMLIAAAQRVRESLPESIR